MYRTLQKLVDILLEHVLTVNVYSNTLKGVERGESKTIMIGDSKFNSITKQYDQTEFRDDSSCVGYTISVYQESINKYIQEYLVNFDYLIEVMTAYGFKVTTSPFNKSKKSIGSFEEFLIC